MMTEYPCPICRAPLTKASGSPLLREVRLHVFSAHREELRARLDNPADPVIAELAAQEIYVNRKDL